MTAAQTAADLAREREAAAAQRQAAMAAAAEAAAALAHEQAAAAAQRQAAMTAQAAAALAHEREAAAAQRLAAVVAAQEAAQSQTAHAAALREQAAHSPSGLWDDDFVGGGGSDTDGQGDGGGAGAWSELDGGGGVGWDDDFDGAGRGSVSWHERGTESELGVDLDAQVGGGGGGSVEWLDADNGSALGRELEGEFSIHESASDRGSSTREADTTSVDDSAGAAGGPVVGRASESVGWQPFVAVGVASRALFDADEGAWPFASPPIGSRGNDNGKKLHRRFLQETIEATHAPTCKPFVPSKNWRPKPQSYYNPPPTGSSQSAMSAHLDKLMKREATALDCLLILFEFTFIFLFTSGLRSGRLGEAFLDVNFVNDPSKRGSRLCCKCKVFGVHFEQKAL